MKKTAPLFIVIMLSCGACSSEYAEYRDKLLGQMHAEECNMQLVKEDEQDILEVELVNIDTAFFNHPEWMLKSYAAQELYYDAIQTISGYDAIRIKLTYGDSEPAAQTYPIPELAYVDTLYTRAEQIINGQQGLMGMIAFRNQFDTVMTDDIFPLIDKAIAESKATNGPQTSLSFGGYRRVQLEYMNTPVVQVIVQQRRTSKTDCWLFSFSEITGLVMSVQLNGQLD